MNSVVRFIGTVAVLFGLATAAAAQNSWMKPASGYWEEPYWSLGMPDFSQNGVLFTNAGWKALGIRRETAFNYPSSLHIKWLAVASPTNSFNTLLLNFVGHETPLRISGYFDLGSGSGLTLLDSALEVGDQLRISGTVTHSDYSVVTAPTAFIGHADAGAYNFTNGTLAVSNELFVGYNYAGTLHQHGGSNVAGLIHVLKQGEYFLHDGDVTSRNMTIGQAYTTNFVVGTGSFHQSGGRVLAANDIRIGEYLSWGFDRGNGQYTLSGGTLTTPFLVVGFPDGRLAVGGDGVFEQSGGSNLATVVSVQGGRSRLASYALSGGLLSTSGSGVSGHAGFDQSGGAHLIDGDLSLGGYYERNFEAIYAGYSLSNGLLRARNLRIHIAGFGQSGGTNEIANELFIQPEIYSSGSYSLSGGRLSTSNTVVFGSYRLGFAQTGGVHSISGMLQLVTDDIRWSPWPNSLVLYTLAAGQLMARDIQLSNGATFRHTGGTISHSGILTLAGGQWQAAPGTHQFGKLQLNTAATNSIFSLPDSAVVLRFGDSSTLPWQDGAQLVIQNWRGSPNGGGSHQIIFAGGSAALTYQQRAKIVFREPAGFGSGDYPARLLASGELVPAPRVGLVTSHSSNKMVIQWPEGFGFVLQTSTNIAGPWADMAGATSPYTNQVTSAPRRFFRVRLYN